MGMLETAHGSVFSSLPSDSPVEAAFLLRRSGAVVASWTRPEVSADVVSVMAATMLASVDTLAGALGCPPSGRVTVETDTCRLLATRAGPGLLLVLLAPVSLGGDGLAREAHRILAGLPRLSADGPVPPAAPGPETRTGSVPAACARPRAKS